MLYPIMHWGRVIWASSEGVDAGGGVGVMTRELDDK